MNERLEANVCGRVQMVMYRDFATRKARGLGLTGFVRNLKDGTVQVVAEGPREKLEQFEKKLHNGPLLAHVETVVSSWHPAIAQFTKFTISYD